MKKNQKTFGETQLSDNDRQSIVSALKEEGFNEEQLNAMAFGKVWNLYIDSIAKTLSDEIAGMAKFLERNPKAASAINPLIKKLTQQLEDDVNSLEEEGKEGDKS